MSRGHRARTVLFALLAGSALGLTACGEGGYEYVSNSSRGLFLRVPDDWSVIEVDTDAGRLGREGVPADWIRLIDASAAPGVGNWQAPVPAEPVGMTAVEPIETYSQRDELSLEQLRTYALSGYVEYDPANPLASDPLQLNQLAEGPVELISIEDSVTFEGGYRGQRIVFNLEVAEQQFVTIDQTAVVDPDTTEVYRLLIKCEATCYADRQAEIDEIVDSWTIDEE